MDKEECIAIVDGMPVVVSDVVPDGWIWITDILTGETLRIEL